MLQFASELDWQRAQQMMQPALIRIIDNIRKQLDNSDWQGSYHSEQIWPEGTPEDHKAAFNALQQQLNSVKTVDEIDAIEHQLAQLPKPMPIYALQLKQGEHHHSVDLWELCYQVCFVNYCSSQATDAGPVQIDITLLDEEARDIDWDSLDDKAKDLVAQIFVQLP